jgi:ParB-like chromosome segregation protein Spo0J
MQPQSPVDLAIQWPADHVERRSVALLIPYARNARTHSDAQVAQIAASIREWGWTVPVLIDEAGGRIAGHGRILAARTLGLDYVPVIVAAGWSEAKRRAYALADNKLALNSGWDEAMLAFELNDLTAMSFRHELGWLLCRGTGGIDRRQVGWAY